MAVGGLRSLFPTTVPFGSSAPSLPPSQTSGLLDLWTLSLFDLFYPPALNGSIFHTVYPTHRPTLMNRAKGSPVHSHIPHNSTNLRMSMVRQARLTRDGRLCARIRPAKWQFSDRISWHFCDHGKRPAIHAASRSGPLLTQPQLTDNPSHELRAKSKSDPALALQPPSTSRSSLFPSSAARQSTLRLTPSRRSAWLRRGKRSPTSSAKRCSYFDVQPVENTKK